MRWIVDECVDAALVRRLRDAGHDVVYVAEIASGAKVGMFGSGMARKVPASTANDPDTARFAVWYDVLGIDSDYDYDPVWAKCLEVGIAPTFHSASSNQGLRLSPTNFVYNHLGHFAAAGHAVAKAIFLGGVTRRFPGLRFAFLEGGVGGPRNCSAI